MVQDKTIITLEDICCDEPFVFTSIYVYMYQKLKATPKVKGKSRKKKMYQKLKMFYVSEGIYIDTSCYTGSATTVDMQPTAGVQSEIT